MLDIDPQSFGGIGVFAIKEMGRFYRHVLIEKRFPHHTAVAFAHAGKALSRPCGCWAWRISVQPAGGNALRREPVSIGDR